MGTIRTVGIRGAGLAGLTMARELIRLEPDISISVFDVRPRLPHPARTFCFFQKAGSFIPPCPSVTWPSVIFRGHSFERRVDVSRTPYTMIHGNDFFENLLIELESSGVSFQWGCRDVNIYGSAILVDGASLDFDCVIDAAFQCTTASSALWQSFAGIRIKAPSPTFDPTTAILMDLRESSEAAPVSFFYILPTSPTTALVEHTTFSSRPLPKQYHLEQCSSWIRSNIGEQVENLEFEHGTIPMGLRIPHAEGSYVTGSNAGTVRPATGYAFSATQVHARRLSEQILRGAPNPRRSYPLWLTAGDNLFLQALRRAPLSGRSLMETLLSRAPSRALIAFLSGDLSCTQALSVWFSIPKMAMIRALLRV
jgi:lycopene beta-cyclase